MANAPQLYLKQAQIGPMANFVYLIGDPATYKAAVVDPAWDVGAILDLAERDGYEIDKILITHYHPDHLGGSMMGHNVQGAADMLHRVKVKVYVNKNEAEGTKRVAGLSDSDLVKVEAGGVFNICNSEVKCVSTSPPLTGSQGCLLGGDPLSCDLRRPG